MDWITNTTRRDAFKTTLQTGLTLLLLPLGTLGDVTKHERRLHLFHTHTRKRLSVVYKHGDRYSPSALQRVNAFMFDFRTGDRIEMDPRLLDLLYDIRVALGSDGIYEIISAYRSPKTNAMLRRRSRGVAKKSQHLLGKAIDVRLTGVDLSTLRDTAIAMQRGGVGYYAKSNFVHLDTGRVRRW